MLATLSRVVRKSFIEKVTLVKDLKELRKLAVWISEGRELQKDGAASAKIKRQDYIWGCSRNIKKSLVTGPQGA